jgi:arylsulfatase A-like enzyme
MKRRNFIGSLGAGAAAALVAPGDLWRVARAAEGAAPADRPNIVLILADDLGYAGVGVQGCADIPTPHIDSIAKAGVRFTHGYVSAPLCSPTRAGLMTGRYQQRFGHETNPGPINQAQPEFGLPLDELTIAERLKKLGYATGMFGKWHLGFSPQFHPTKRGFDEFFGFLGGAHSYLPGSGQMNDGRIQRGTEPVEEKEYLTDALAREAVSFIDRHKSDPFFVYLPFNAVHTPMEAGQKYLDRFKDIKDDLRRTHAAMVSAMDDGIGRVLARIREHDLEEKTLVIFLSDNGGPTPQTTSSNAPLRGFKAQALEGGIRIPFMMQWKGRLPAGKVDARPVISLDLHPTIVAAAAGAGGSAAAAPAVDSAWKLDGIDILPYAAGEKDGVPHETLFWRMFSNQRAVRHGDLKLVWSGPAGPLSPPGRLYDVVRDPGETRDLSAERPDDLKKLQALYDAWNATLAEPKWKMPPLRQGMGQGAGQAPGRAFLQNLDPNMTKDQFRKWFDARDANKDGKLLPDEFPRPQIFRLMDRNADGGVTFEEAWEFVSAWIKR